MVRLVVGMLTAIVGAAAHGQVDDLAEVPALTFADVAPIVEGNCAGCHHDHGVAPFPLLSFEDVASKKAMIREVVAQRRMPPWHADGRYGSFANDRRLSKQARKMLIDWIDAGAPEGARRAVIERPPSDDVWLIGEPDIVFSMPTSATIPATGVLPYQYFETPTNFASDRWVTAVEAKPGNPKVVHHILVYVQERSMFGGNGRLDVGAGLLDGYAPGDRPLRLPEGVAIRVPAGATLLWQIHYTPTGKEERDQSRIGLTFADRPPQREMTMGAAMNTQFVIPAGARNSSVGAQFQFGQNAWLLSLTPHMHLRGRSFTYWAYYPNGKREVLLHVPRYDFNWQTTYQLRQPKALPAGTMLMCTGVFDNSARNPANPNPKMNVGWGDQTWEEMMIGWFSYAWDAPPRP